MSERPSVTASTQALLDATRQAILAHYAVCTLGCSIDAVACVVGQMLALAEDDVWWAGDWETLPPHAPIYTDETSIKAVAR